MNKLLFTQRGNRILCVILPLIIALFALSVKFTGRLIPFLSTPPCLLKYYTGLDCPSCGGTRAAFALFRFDILAALKFNPLMTIIYIVFAIWFVRFAFNAFRKKYRVPFNSKWYSVVLLTIFTAMIAFFVIRNLY